MQPLVSQPNSLGFRPSGTDIILPGLNWPPRPLKITFRIRRNLEGARPQNPLRTPVNQNGSQTRTKSTAKRATTRQFQRLPPSIRSQQRSWVENVHRPNWAISSTIVQRYAVHYGTVRNHKQRYSRAGDEKQNIGRNGLGIYDLDRQIESGRNWTKNPFIGQRVLARVQRQNFRQRK